MDWLILKYWIIGSGIGGVLALLVFASAYLKAGIYVRPFFRKKTREKVVALTFDDGVVPGRTEKVLDVLRSHGIKATFFLIGRNVEAYPEMVRELIAEGHVVGSHSWEHNPARYLRLSDYHYRDMLRMQDVIGKACGKTPVYYRPPLGVTTPHVGIAVRRAKVKVIGWSVRSFDTRGIHTTEEVCEGVMKRIRPGGVILLHDRCDEAPQLTEMLIGRLKDEGYRFVTIEELSGIKAYKEE